MSAVEVVQRMIGESDARLDQYRRAQPLDRWAKHDYEYEKARNTTLHTVLGEIRRDAKNDRA